MSNNMRNIKSTYNSFLTCCQFIILKYIFSTPKRAWPHHKSFWISFFTSMNISCGYHILKMKFKPRFVFKIISFKKNIQFDWSKSLLGMNRHFRPHAFLINFLKLFPLLMPRYMLKFNFIPQCTIKMFRIQDLWKLIAWEHFKS